MTSKFGYTYETLPSADLQGGSIETSAFKALKEEEMGKIQEQNPCTDATSKDDNLDSGCRNEFGCCPSRTSKKQLDANLKNLKNEDEVELTRSKSKNIDDEVIILLAMRLIDLPCNSRGNEIMEIAAALLDEVDRTQEIYKVQMLDEQAIIRKNYGMKVGKHNVNEEEVSLISQFEFADSDHTSMGNNSTIGERQSSDTGGSQGRRLEELEKKCMALNEKVDDLEQT
ncbi:hypothetical protein V866_006764 [Kwoniella sp. B9012]